MDNKHPILVKCPRHSSDAFVPFIKDGTYFIDGKDTEVKMIRCPVCGVHFAYFEKEDKWDTTEKRPLKILQVCHNADVCKKDCNPFLCP